ncbi:MULTISPECIES: DUF4422 domain-containing protein [Lactiplantibacillus]|uniref:DUF4422 domain-containing protein n=1 Tax=Lactiplantibacillus TaxID=2767842 RepID=UPI0021A45262|nr:DUF4422 domain-containing protein [Lactiplantibacillus plantarum]MCT3247366.1 DUF4422 domain-containing protein [Lactiplantibacillus plantarum]
MANIKIIVATHKIYEMPIEKMYLPVRSGAALNDNSFGYQPDDVGDNISSKNLNYSELTALYWAWKNLNSDYKGLVHYRRYFANGTHFSIFRTGKFNEILTEKKLNELLSKNDVILPSLRHYYIETVKSHYEHTHHKEDLEITREVLCSLFPEYVGSFDEILSRKSAHMFNMMIMKSELFDGYCEWLFGILNKVEEKLDISSYSAFHARVFGRISEILLDVWIDKNGIQYKEIPVMFMENQNWTKKIIKFLKAKFLKKRY